MANANSLILKATHAAQAHERATGLYSYAFQVGVLESIVRDLCAQLNDYLPPATGRSEYETTWSGSFAEYVVHYDFHASDDEVGMAEDVTVNGVFLHGTDIQGELSEKTLAMIEEHCIEAANQAALDAQISAAEDRAERMRDERMGV